jgi:hypothetical protein
VQTAGLLFQRGSIRDAQSKWRVEAGPVTAAILEHFGFEIDLLTTIDTSHVSDQEKVIRHKIAELKAELGDQFGPEFAVFDTGERMIAIARNVGERADGLPARIFS